MAEYKVTDWATLKTALGKAVGGDTIILAPGNYSTNTISNKTYDKPLTIMSEDMNNKAVMSRLVVSNVSNVVFKGIEVGPSTATSGDTAEITKSSKITFDSMSIHGTLDNDPTADKGGLSIKGSNNIVVKNSEFQQAYRGMMVQSSQDVTISGNSIHDVRSDGIDIAQVTNLTIDSNRFESFHKAGADHPDAIQMWTTDTTAPSKNIKITNNQILGGNGAGMQGIFLKDEIGIGFSDVLIENNLVYDTTYGNGIATTGGSNVTIRGNTVTSPQSGAMMLRVQNTANATVENNVTDSFYILGTNPGLTFSGNSTLKQTQAAYGTRLTRKMTETFGTGYDVRRLVVPGVGYQIKGVGSALDLAGYVPSNASTVIAGNDLSAGTLGDTLAAMTPLAPAAASSILWSDWASVTSAAGGTTFSSLVTSSQSPLDLAAGVAA